MLEIIPYAIIKNDCTYLTNTLSKSKVKEPSDGNYQFGFSYQHTVCLIYLTDKLKEL